MTLEYYGLLEEPAEIDRTWDFKEKLYPRINIAEVLGSDLRPFSSPRHNQSHSGSCVAQGIVKAAEVKRIMEHGHADHVDLSRLAVYFLARELMDPPMTQMDKGTYVSFGADVLRRFGVCSEAHWPFDLNKLFVPPSWKAMRKAYVGKISAFYKINSTGSERVDDITLALAAGNPVVFGTKVGQNWRDYGPGSEPLDVVEGTILGGHCTVLMGWNPQKEVFYGENSWGTGWGIKPDMVIGYWGDTPSHTKQGGYYEMRPSVIKSSQAHDFIVMEGGWEPWAA